MSRNKLNRLTVLVIERSDRGSAWRVTAEMLWDPPVSKDSVEWFWAISWNKGYYDYVPCLLSYDSDTKCANLSFNEEQLDFKVGDSLFCFRAYWQGYHFRMVDDPGWPWRQITWRSSAAKESFFTDAEGNRWRVLQDSTGQKSRLYPMREQDSAEVLMIDWDHEHCELCNTHIENGFTAFQDEDSHFLCVACYEKYVLPHDLTFLTE